MCRAPFRVTLCRASTLHTKSNESPRTLLHPHKNTMGGNASVCNTGGIIGAYRLGHYFAGSVTFINVSAEALKLQVPYGDGR